MRCTQHCCVNKAAAIPRSGHSPGGHSAVLLQPAPPVARAFVLQCFCNPSQGPGGSKQHQHIDPACRRLTRAFRCYKPVCAILGLAIPVVCISAANTFNTKPTAIHAATHLHTLNSSLTRTNLFVCCAVLCVAPSLVSPDVTRRASQLLLAHRGLLTAPQLARLAAKLAEVGMTAELRELVDGSGASGSHAGQAVGFVAAALTGGYHMQRGGRRGGEPTGRGWAPRPTNCGIQTCLCVSEGGEAVAMGPMTVMRCVGAGRGESRKCAVGWLLCACMWADTAVVLSKCHVLSCCS